MLMFTATRSHFWHVAIQTGQLDHHLLEPDVVFVFAELGLLIAQRGDGSLELVAPPAYLHRNSALAVARYQVPLVRPDAVERAKIVD